MALVQVGKRSESRDDMTGTTGSNIGNNNNNNNDEVVKDANEFINLYMEIGQKKGLEGLEELRKSVDDVVARRREKGK